MVEVFNDPTTIDVIVQFSRLEDSIRRPDLNNIINVNGVPSISTISFDRNGSRYTLYYDDRTRHWAPFQATIEPL